ncbi:MAG: hypothetical protein ABIO21_26030, partial [Pseudomonas sp.]
VVQQPDSGVAGGDSEGDAVVRESCEILIFLGEAADAFASKPAPTLGRVRLDNSVTCGGGLAREER